MGRIQSNGMMLYDDSTKRVAGFMTLDGKEQPFADRLLVSRQIGSVATPLATLTGSAGALFTFTGAGPASIQIPAGLILPNSRVHVEALVKRTGATATANFEAYLGTAGTNGDSLLTRVVMSASDGNGAYMFGEGWFGTSPTSFVATGQVGPGSSSGGNTFIDKTTNINTALPMYLSFGMASSNAADSFALLGLQVIIESL